MAKVLLAPRRFFVWLAVSVFAAAIPADDSATVCRPTLDADSAALPSDAPKHGFTATANWRTASSCSGPRGKTASMLLQARSSVVGEEDSDIQQAIPLQIDGAEDAGELAFNSKLPNDPEEPEILSLHEWFAEGSKAAIDASKQLEVQLESIRESITVKTSISTTESFLVQAPSRLGPAPAAPHQPAVQDDLVEFSVLAFVPAWLHGGGAGTQRDVFVGLMLFVCFLGFMLACAWPRSRENWHELAPFRHEVRREIDEDIYGMLIATLVLDTTTIARERASNNKVAGARWARILVSSMFLAITIMFQAFMLAQIAGITNGQAVRGMQQAYNQYEIHMYNGHTAQLAPDVIRGIPGHYNVSLFPTLSDSLKTEICRMPLSRIDLLMGILIIWTFAAIIEFKAALACMLNFVIGMPTLQSMEEAMRFEGNKRGNGFLSSSKDEGEAVQTIVGLTSKVKCVILVFIVVPRVSMVVTLTWLGCRWLTSTNDFGDLILDAVALEFVLLLKNLLYSALAPYQSKLDIRRTFVAPLRGSDRPSAREYVGSFAWGIAVLCWVILYLTFFQSVLPGYRWDISIVCSWHA